MCTPITESEYHQANNDMQGFCTNCKEFTRGMCEPDAEKYECPECEKNTVYGTEDSLILGFITIT